MSPEMVALLGYCFILLVFCLLGCLFGWMAVGFLNDDVFASAVMAIASVFFFCMAGVQTIPIMEVMKVLAV